MPIQSNIIGANMTAGFDDLKIKRVISQEHGNGVMGSSMPGLHDIVGFTPRMAMN